MSIDINSISDQLEKQGFSVISQVLESEMIDTLIAEVHSVLKRNGAPNGCDYAMRNLAQSVSAVRRVAEIPAIRRLVEPVLGSECFVVRSLFFDKTTGANWKVPWHQDLTIAVTEKLDLPGFTAWSVKEGVVHVQPPVSLLERMLTVRLHLDDCDSGNGPLQVIPGSHQAGRLDAADILDWRSRQTPLACIVPRGGALLMRPLLLHASSPAHTPKHRRVMHLEFAAECLPNGLRWAT